MGMLPPVFVELRANISEFSAKMGEAKHEIHTLEREGRGSFDKLASVGKAALLGIGAAGVGVGTMAIEMADQYEASHARLETAIKNTGSDFEELSGQIDKVSKANELLGFNNSDTEAALASLTTATQDPKKALDLLSTAADLARYKNIDLADAAVAVGKAANGNLKPIKQLGLDLPLAAGGAAKLEAATGKLATAQDKAAQFLAAHGDAANKHSKYHEKYAALLAKVDEAQQKVNDTAGAGQEIMKALSGAIGGQATAASETFGGKMAALKAQSEDMAKNIGMKLIPVLMKLMDKMQEGIKWAGEHKTAMEVLAGVFGGALAIAIGAYIVNLTKAGIASVRTAATSIASAVSTAAAWISANAAMILATGGIILAIGLLVAAGVWLYKHWDEVTAKVKHAFAAMGDWIREKAAAVKGFFEGIWHGMGDFVKSAFSRVGDVVKGYFNFYIGLINTVIRAINGIHVKVPDWVPGIGGKDFGLNIPQIPKLAEGGIVSRPTVALVGEAGPEAVVPLRRLGGGGVNVTVHVHGSVVQERDLAVAVRDNIAQLMRRKGLNPGILGV